MLLPVVMPPVRCVIDMRLCLMTLEIYALLLLLLGPAPCAPRLAPPGQKCSTLRPSRRYNWMSLASPPSYLLCDIGLPPTRTSLIVAEPCISTVSLKGKSLEEINRLWLADMKAKIVADPLIELRALMQL